MKFKQTQLANGLTIIAEINEDSKSMAAGFFVRTGSRDETPEISGVSHFLEHMVFKGTARRSPFDVNREFDRMGAAYNAFTSEENTVFYLGVLPEFQDDGLDLLADIMRPSLREEDFNVEKGVIQEEIALYEDQPKFRVYDKLMHEHFGEHPLANMILGTRESIAAMKCDDMMAYFNRRYSAGNLTAVGTGNLDFKKFVAKLEQMCGAWEHYEVGREIRDSRGTEARKVIQDEKVQREHIGLMSAAPSAQDEQRYAAELATMIVGDVVGSRLYYALVEPAIADEASMSYIAHDGTGAFVTFISADPPRAAEALEIAQKELAAFVTGGPSESEMLAAKNKIASGATIKGELPLGRMRDVGLDWVYRKTYEPMEQQIAELFAVNRRQIMDVVNGYDMRRTTLTALGPLGQL